MDDFLKSKAMMTPGIAGSATTMITGTLVSQFGFPGAFTAMVVSFIFGLLVWADTNVAILQRVIFYIINSITIFSVALGLNQAGIAIAESEKQPQQIERSVPPDENDHAKSPTSKNGKPFFQSWL